MNISPVAVEDALLQALPELAAAYVVGTENARWGEDVCAVVILRDSAGPEEQMAREDDRQRARSVIRALSAREQRVIELRFGIGVRRSHTLRENGEEMGLTRERNRQIEVVALRKMRRIAEAQQR